MKQNNFWSKVRKVLINQYAITLYVFAILFLFVGEHSLIKQFSRKREIRQTRNAIEQISAQTTKSQNLLQSLSNIDSLEYFAREQYHMHTEQETVYVVE